MEKMFGDVELSKGLNDQFRHHLETTNTKVAGKLLCIIITASLCEDNILIGDQVS